VNKTAASATQLAKLVHFASRLFTYNC